MPATLEAPSDFSKTLTAALTSASETDDAAPPVEQPVETPLPTPVQPENNAGPPEETKEIPSPAQAEGLDAQLLRQAIDAGLPSILYSKARTNEQLAEYIADFGQLDREETTDPSPADAWKVQLPIPEADFDASDPLHQSLKLLADKHNTLLAAYDGLYKTTEQLIARNENDSKRAEAVEFDSGIDALGIDFGASMSKERKEIYKTYHTLGLTQPDLKPTERARRAALATYPDAFAKQAVDRQLEAVKNQQQQTLGGGAAPPAAPQKLSGMDAFKAFLRQKTQEAAAAGM
jgi:hypothetical protein